MTSVLGRGLAYFAAVFAAGFAFGVARELWLASWLGRSTAVYLELPVMLIVSGAAAWAVTGRYPRPDVRAAASIGAVAFALLMLAEVLVGLLLRRMTWAEYFAYFGTRQGAASLAAYAVFGLLPWIVAHRRRR